MDNLSMCYYNAINIYIKYSSGQKKRSHSQWQRHKQCAFHLEKMKESDVLWISFIHKMQNAKKKRKKKDFYL